MMDSLIRSKRRVADSAPEDSELDNELAGDSENQTAYDETLDRKQACNRCRRRKIRCNRAITCSNCARSRSDCSYPAIGHHREKRQRIHMSAKHEQKIDRIFEVLDELRVKVDNLSQEAHPRLSGGHNEEATSSNVEPENQPSLLSHAVFASQFLRALFGESNGPRELVRKMELSLGALHGVIDSQRQQKTTLHNVYPYARTMPQGTSLGGLRMPPVEISLECLQKAKECQRVQFFWLSEFVSLSQFTEYLVKVYSPGPSSNTERIIVLGGIFWLFCECALDTADAQTRERFWNQAALSREALETDLYHLPFHTPINFDSVLAMSIAASYCFRTGKISAAWNFTTNAAHLCQALGFHRPHVLSADSPDLKQRKAKLLWTIFTLERNLSLQLGRPSTFHVDDIALPQLSVAPNTTADFPFNITLTKHIHVAALQGRAYNEIYSLGALSQPIEIRTRRAEKLASELRNILEHEDEIETRYSEARRHALGSTLHELFQCAARINELSLLTLLYRGIPPDKSSDIAFCNECVDTARAALEEHQRSISIITSSHVKGHPLEMYINWSFLLFPFFPFIVLFCHIAQTFDQSDLHLLKSVVETLESIPESAFYQTHSKQIRLFRALYDVAQTYIELKTSEVEPQIASWDFNQMLTTIGVPFLPQASDSLLHSTHIGTADAMPIPTIDGAASHYVNQGFDDVPGSSGTFTAEIDETALELGNWFQGNHEMLRLLDDSYLRQ
ncbi:hypothetical protein P170DRAFT_400256 [Aspergillus steynii IBT 23096]|uniref:Zn(2)-C6 fungal-type domain-containing protein n=1 Tax=Aspergillus steynii IBT 23096 TaxID=1392250 RepID=A0A2I2GEY9_9EURO|nr:uncharacterized protein P170DRAFT_400256 [Aspergillus steynii IBT 23096]PLB51397.1 hypothetical protein P170DRAFT_400256 [Aspergillus steynii IBT 23096]